MTLEIRNINAATGDFASQLDELRQKLSPRGDVVSEAGRKKTIDVFGEALSPAQVVARICSDVQQQGVAAVLDYGLRLDAADLNVDQLRIPAKRLAAAHAAADKEFLQAVRNIRENIRDFQQAILHRDTTLVHADGTRLRQRYLPLKRIGVCIPGGAAAYPSSVLMTVVPAQAAGVSEIAIVAPPTDFGANNTDVLATCHELGVTEVYQVGGAQAVAALAFGVEGITAVDKIVGPGNLFVALAKQHVFGTVDIDSIAGPSEVVVLADDTTSPVYAAAELLAQAEHAPGASLLISWSDSAIAVIQEVLEQQLAGLSRHELIRQSLADFGALILARDKDQACEITNLIAPEHLYIDTEDPHELLKQITNAGATFLGPFSPVAAGDYVAGPSHVLPTGGTARWASGLSANSFLRSSSVIHISQQGLVRSADDLRILAEREGLTAHWSSVARRLDESDS